MSIVCIAAEGIVERWLEGIVGVVCFVGVGIGERARRGGGIGQSAGNLGGKGRLWLLGP